MRDLPPRMYRKHGAFWHVKQNKWTRLAPLDNPQEAIRRYAALEAGDGETLGDAITRFLANHVPTLAERTQPDYEAACEALRAWAGHLYLGEIGPRDVARYLDRCQPATLANKRIAVLSSIYRREVSAGRADVNPCLGVPKRPNPRRDYVPSQTEIAALRAGVNEQTRVAMDLALATALRLSDMLALTRENVSGGELRARIRKTGGVVVYEITPGLREILDRCGNPALIPNRKGKPYTVGGWESLWQRQKAAAGFRHIRWHDLRARALTDAHRLSGRDYAQALAAHHDGSTTERYLRDRGETRVRPLDSHML